MIFHKNLGKTPFKRSKTLHQLIENGDVSLGGNWQLKIYGTLTCRAGKRMKVENRVFFKDLDAALAGGFRPCAVCLRDDYRIWKQKSRQ